MPVYRVELVETVRRAANIQAPDGFNPEGVSSRARLIELARDVAVEMSVETERIVVVEATSGEAVDARLG